MRAKLELGERMHDALKHISKDVYTLHETGFQNRMFDLRSMMRKLIYIDYSILPKVCVG